MLDMPTADALARYMTLASQQMKLTAANMANQNTANYTRRVVTWNEGDSVQVNGMNASTGVSATATAQRDRVLQRSVQQATEAASASGTRLTALNNLQNLFAIDPSGGDASGIGAAIGGFFSAASALAASPTDGTAQQALYAAAQAVASTLNRAANQIASQTASLNQQVSTSVAQVNGLAAQVAALNRQISQTGAGDSLDTLIDQRDGLVTQISQLTGVNTISSEQNQVSLALSDGTPLVSGSTALPLVTVTTGGIIRICANAAAGGSEVTGAMTGGSIGGALQARDSDLPAVTKQLDTIAQTIATAVNTQNAAGTTSAGTAGGAIFSGTTAASLIVTATGASAFAVSSSSASDGGNASALGALGDASLVNGQTISGAFAGMISALGQTASDALTKSSADAAVQTQTGTQLANLSGVSLDTEAANLTQYQRSYEAAAKVLSIVNELMAQAINLGEPTTVT